jgi:pimeloyl-ACP methyl ester carboxylesterase
MMNAPQDCYIKIGQINARYWADGNQGSPVILIHGIGGYIESWLPNFATLATQHQVYAVDLPGHGRTEKPRNISYTIESLSQFINDFMAARGVEKAHIVGHSLGGAIGTRLALRQPEAVDRLVLVGSAGLGKGGAMMLKIVSIPLLGEVLTRPSLSGSASSTKILVYNPTVMTDDLIELSYQMSALPGAQQSFLRTLRSNANFLGQKESMYGTNTRGIASITNPVLVIWGRQDQVIPVAHADTAAKGFPNVQVHIFDNCGHLPMLEYTSEFNRLILDFLSD